MTLAAEFATMLAADHPGKPQAAAGQPSLSAPERELVTVVARGHTDTQIASSTSQ